VLIVGVGSTRLVLGAGLLARGIHGRIIAKSECHPATPAIPVQPEISLRHPGPVVPRKEGHRVTNPSSTYRYALIRASAHHPCTGPVRLLARVSPARRALLIAVPLTAALLMAGCGSVNDAARRGTFSRHQAALSDLHAVSARAARTFLGSVPGSRALIGIVLNRGRAEAYICDGTSHRAGTLADWFRGPVQGGMLDATSSLHHARLAAHFSGRRGTGTITLAGGRVLSFTVALVTGAHQAGIFAGTARYRGRDYRAGWIILPDGDERGAAFYPSGPTRGLMIAISSFPTGPV
jgi:hypothetical protein